VSSGEKKAIKQRNNKFHTRDYSKGNAVVEGKREKNKI
jgi:hypothetical protein